jgi:hypothetical protein
MNAKGRDRWKDCPWEEELKDKIPEEIKEKEEVKPSRIMKLNNWSVVYGEQNPYLAPELRSARLHGIVDDHPRLGKNVEVTTSKIVKAEGLIITTNSGSIYELELVDLKYLEYLQENNINFNPKQPITILVPETS